MGRDGAMALWGSGSSGIPIRLYTGGRLFLRDYPRCRKAWAARSALVLGLYIPYRRYVVLICNIHCVGMRIGTPFAAEFARI